MLPIYLLPIVGGRVNTSRFSAHRVLSQKMGWRILTKQNLVHTTLGISRISSPVLPPPLRPVLVLAPASEHQSCWHSEIECSLVIPGALSVGSANSETLVQLVALVETSISQWSPDQSASRFGNALYSIEGGM